MNVIFHVWNKHQKAAWLAVVVAATFSATIAHAHLHPSNATRTTPPHAVCICTTTITLLLSPYPCREKTVTSPAAGSNGASKPSPQPPRPGVQKSVFFRTVPAEAAARRPEASRVQQLVYPEVSDSAYGMQHIRKKPSLGLAMSGGGFRAATCAAGWTRGLQKVRAKPHHIQTLNHNP